MSHEPETSAAEDTTPPPPPESTDAEESVAEDSPARPVEVQGSWPQQEERAPRSPLAKSPRLAALLSIFPGLGHVYNGLYQRAVIFFALFQGGVLIASENETFIPVVLFLYLFNVLDSWRQASLINLGYATDLGMLDEPGTPRPGQGTLLAGLALVAIGTLSLADEWLGVDFDRVLEAWPILLVGCGVWLIWVAIRESRD